MMKIGLVGYTGFVGSNILKQLKDSGYEDRELKLYNSKHPFALCLQGMVHRPAGHRTPHDGRFACERH